MDGTISSSSLKFRKNNKHLRLTETKNGGWGGRISKLRAMLLQEFCHYPTFYDDVKLTIHQPN